MSRVVKDACLAINKCQCSSFFLLGDLLKTRRLEATRGKGRASC